MPSKRLRAPRPTLLPQPLLQEALGSGSGHNLISEHALIPAERSTGAGQMCPAPDEAQEHTDVRWLLSLSFPLAGFLFV